METAKKMFEELWDDYEKTDTLISSLNSRKSKNEKEIIELQEQLDSLKSKRPMMLADEIDVTKLNKQINQLDEKIMLKNEENSGLDVKLPPIRSKRRELQKKLNTAYEEYIGTYLDSLKMEYNIIAEKFAEITKEFITFQKLRYSPYGYNSCQLISQKIKMIPNADNDNESFFDSNYCWNIIDDYIPKIIEKYNLIDFKYFGSYTDPM